MNQETKVITGIGVISLIVLFGGVFFLSKKDEQASKPLDQKVLMANIKHEVKAKNANVTVVEFADFQCPACGAFHPFVKQVLKKDTGKFTFIYRHFPLPQHKNARLAAKAAEAAGEQDKFWEMSDTLFEKQNEWSESDDALSIFATYAKPLGLNVDTFTQEVKSNKFDQTIQTDYSDGTNVGVDSTPTFFLNGKKLVLNSFDDLQKAIDAEIKK